MASSMHVGDRSARPSISCRCSTPRPRQRSISCRIATTRTGLPGAGGDPRGHHATPLRRSTHRCISHRRGRGSIATTPGGYPPIGSVPPPAANRRRGRWRRSADQIAVADSLRWSPQNRGALVNGRHHCPRVGDSSRPTAAQTTEEFAGARCSAGAAYCAAGLTASPGRDRERRPSPRAIGEIPVICGWRQRACCRSGPPAAASAHCCMTAGTAASGGKSHENPGSPPGRLPRPRMRTALSPCTRSPRPMRARV